MRANATPQLGDARAEGAYVATPKILGSRTELRPAREPTSPRGKPRVPVGSLVQRETRYSMPATTAPEAVRLTLMLSTASAIEAAAGMMQKTALPSPESAAERLPETLTIAWAFVR